MNIDWKLFAERVLPGTRVRDQNCIGEIHHDGILLEMYPHQQQEEGIDYGLFSLPKYEKQFHENPHLMIQDLESIEPYSLLIHDWVVFLIDDQWLTFEQVMK